MVAVTVLAPLSRKRLATVGEVLTVFLAVDGSPLQSSTQFRRITAGAEANVAAGFVRLGHVATLGTVIGNDPLGDAALADVRSWGVDVLARRADRAGGMLVRTLGQGPRLDAVHLRHGAAAEDLDVRDSAAAWSTGADVVFVTGITLVRSESAQRAVLDLVARARERGALVVVDPNIRRSLASASTYSTALSLVSPYADIALGDATELAALAGANEANATRALLDMGYQVVVEKRGAQGAVATTAHGSFTTPTVSWSVVDTVGAGDAFTAGFVTAVVEGLDVEAALYRASLVAAHVVATPGDVEGFPMRREIVGEEQKGR